MSRITIKRKSAIRINGIIHLAILVYKNRIYICRQHYTNFQFLTRPLHLHKCPGRISYLPVFVLQISIWRPCRTKDTHSTRLWGWEVWDQCSADYTLAVVLTASPGPLITETAGLRRPKSDH